MKMIITTNVKVDMYWSITFEHLDNRYTRAHFSVIILVSEKEVPQSC